MKFLVVGILIVLLAGLALSMIFSSALKSAMHNIGAKITIPASITATPNGGGNAPPPAPTYIAPAANNSVPSSSQSSSSSVPFHGPTSYPHANGPTSPPPGM